ncbi:hypothetical protein F2P56_005042 [Juglans regia]|uniref:Uncharacterized protein LOC109010653 n=2 Tax=Juglans regia TaxID=51240 RepID=A0A2I4GT73_JUGRE|nr:uncharacterized protein LOC109010653 [Juglans regia]KAF5478485.1 hypothetical protein F2P56_005042 [Juglans regia]
MASRVVQLLMLLSFIWFLLLGHNEVAANWGLSREEEARFKQQLTSLEKSAVKSIHEGGDIYDCVDFYTQPGFSHPLWKNTTFQTKRKLFMQGLRSTAKLPLNIGLKDGGCPYGTVPIKRTGKDELHSELFPSNLEEEPGHHYAVLQTKPDPNTMLEGTESYFGLYNPKGVNGTQFSSFRLKISNGGDSIKAGFMVYPLLFKDTKTRLFAHVVVDKKMQCYNQGCPGYVQNSPRIPLGWPISHTSVVGGHQYAIRLQISKQYISTGPNSTEYIWSLQFHDNLYTYVGMWPAAMFGSLYNVGNQADWGGEVYSPPDQPSPHMGTGILPQPNGDSRYAHSRGIAISYPNSRSLYVNPDDTILYASDPKFYNIMDRGYMNDNWGRMILYDGPGGIKGA